MPLFVKNRITSCRNPKIVNLVSLIEKKKERREQGLFAVEGERELRTCISCGFILESIFVCPDIADASLLAGLDSLSIRKLKNICLSDKNVFAVTPSVYSRIAYREGTEGVLAVFRSRNLSLSDLKPKGTPLIPVLENVEKPGNIGAVLRTADGAGADCVLLCDCPTDLYNPNVIRSSLGAVFSVPVVCCTSMEAVKWLKDNDIAIYSAQLQNSRAYYGADMKRACALVMGSEDKGLTQIWRESSDERLLIPMLGKMDSLNVSISASILCYEAVRQRI